MVALGIVALCLSAASLALAAAAWWQSGEYRRDLRARIRAGYAESLVRIDALRARLGRLGGDGSDELRRGIETLRGRVAETRAEIEQVLTGLGRRISLRAVETQAALRRRVLRLEARLQLLLARGETARAERLADKGELEAARDLLEDAVDRIREVKQQLAEARQEEPEVDQVLGALYEAIGSLREHAEDRRHRIESVLFASDSLIASLDTREQARP